MQRKLGRHDSSGGQDGFAAVLTSCALVLTAGVATLATIEIGPLSLQMLQHLAVMNVLTPLIALPLARRLASPSANLIWTAGLMQMLLLWGWHAPPFQHALSASPLLQLALLLPLAAAALLFWSAVIAAGASFGWSALAALMLTGKFACLLGALLIFSPRDLYGLPGLVLVLCTTGPSTLADQQLAGLLMITACPLSYLVAGVILAAQMLGRIDARADGDVAARSR